MVGNKYNKLPHMVIYYSHAKKRESKTTKNTFNKSKANPSTSSKDVGEWNLVAFWFLIMEAPNPTNTSYTVNHRKISTCSALHVRSFFKSIMSQLMFNVHPHPHVPLPASERFRKPIFFRE